MRPSWQHWWPASWQPVPRTGTAPRTRPWWGAVRPRPGRTTAADWAWAPAPAVIRGAGAPARTDQHSRPRRGAPTKAAKATLGTFQRRRPVPNVALGTLGLDPTLRSAPWTTPHVALGAWLAAIASPHDSARTHPHPHRRARRGVRRHARPPLPHQRHAGGPPR